MKLHELRSVRNVVASGLRVTAAAESSHASQPGVSRHLSSVEEELGVTLFERRRNRLVGLTPAGQAIVPAIARVLDQLDGIHRLARQYSAGAAGSLTIATSHTHARYLLPPAIEQFIKLYPQVRLVVKQGNLDQIIEWLGAGEADLSLSAAPAHQPASLQFHPLSTIHRIVLVPAGHPLLAVRRLTLEKIASFPIITYGREFGAHAQIVKAFEDEGLTPVMALNTSDTDTIKTYAACGLGVAILADSAFEPTRDLGLRAIDASHLFPPSIVSLGINRERQPNVHGLALAEFLSPRLRKALETARTATTAPARPRKPSAPPAGTASRSRSRSAAR
jgi:LysR family transcriptional regulator, cys regulon transcriptional activator